MEDVTPLQYETPPTDVLPTNVRVLAWVLIGIGILSTLDMIIAPFFDRFSLNFGFLGVFAGRGLLRRSNTWRRGVVFLLALNVCFLAVAMPAIAVIALASGGDGMVANLGPLRVTGMASLFVGLPMLAAMGGLLYWPIHILKKRVTRRAFGQKRHNPYGWTPQED